MNTKNVDWLNAKEFTFSLIMEYSPDEIRLSELVWDEVIERPSEDLSHVLDRDSFLGIGAEIAETTILSAVLIPVIVATLSGLATSSIALETVKVFKTSGILEKKNTEKLEKC